MEREKGTIMMDVGIVGQNEVKALDFLRTKDLFGFVLHW